MIVGERRHYRQGRQIENLDDCVAGDDVDGVEVTGTETVSSDKKIRRHVGRMGQGSSAQRRAHTHSPIQLPPSHHANYDPQDVKVDLGLTKWDAQPLARRARSCHGKCAGARR